MFTSFRLAFLISCVAVLAAWTQPVAAGEPGASDWTRNDAGRVRLISATTTTGDAGDIRLGLHFQLNDHWKIYWRTPGDAGYPPKLDWSGSANVGPATIAWPAPKRFQLAGLQNHGYSGEVVLPIAMPILEPGQPVALNLSMDYLACSDICVPMQAKMQLDLPAGPAEPSAFAHDISRFLALVPGDGARHGLTVDTLESQGSGDQSRLRLTVSSTMDFQHPDLFVEPAETASFDAPQMSLSSDRRHLIIEASVVPGTLNRPLADGPVTVTLTDGDRSLEMTATPMPSGLPPTAMHQANGDLAVLAGMVLIALLGGVILNLMPCVLPVLSIKVLGAISHGGAERHHVRLAFLASAAGIVASFLVLAGAAIAVKAAGQAVGWGIQFQQPVFLAAMIVLLLAFAANLWGFYEIRLPGILSGVGTGGTPRHTILGHFLSGAFATLLATPCSAPFLGTAVGFALARGPGEIMTIFVALGLGMAAPYLAMAAWPDAARRLPRPGAWMLTVRKILGLALVATAIWLGTILATQTGLWSSGPDARTADKSAVAWVPFSQDAIARDVAAGKVVFVDVTADWCITCKVNKATVVERDGVAKRLNQSSVVAMRADWTKPDDAIARYLASFGRYGIPFNVVYGPGAPQGIALSELLTESEILSALTQAAAP